MKNLFDVETTLEEIEAYVVANFSDGSSKHVNLDRLFNEKENLISLTCRVNSTWMRSHLELNYYPNGKIVIANQDFSAHCPGVDSLKQIVKHFDLNPQP